MKCSRSIVFANLEGGTTDTALQCARGLRDIESIVEDGIEVR